MGDIWREWKRPPRPWSAVALDALSGVVSALVLALLVWVAGRATGHDWGDAAKHFALVWSAAIVISRVIDQLYAQWRARRLARPSRGEAR